PMVPGVCWEVMEGRGGVVRNGGVGQKTGEEGLVKLAGKMVVNSGCSNRGEDKVLFGYFHN
nr:hypothetical protein [Tanacetum cinerariifolium]